MRFYLHPLYEIHIGVKHSFSNAKSDAIQLGVTTVQ